MKKEISDFIKQFQLPVESDDIEWRLYALNLKLQADKQGLSVKFYGAIINDKE